MARTAVVDSAKDIVTSGSTTTSTLSSFSASASAKTLIVLAFQDTASTSNDPSTMTFDGNSMTVFPRSQANPTQGRASGLGIYDLSGSGATTGDIVVTFGGSNSQRVIIAVTIDGYVTAASSFQDSTADIGGNLFVTADEDNSLFLGFIASNNETDLTVAEDDGQTVVIQTLSSEITSLYGAACTLNPSGSTDMSWTIGGNTTTVFSVLCHPSQLGSSSGGGISTLHIGL
jgi:hypothetical protein